MKVYSIKCPECGANLNIEEGRETCYCSYCGTRACLDDEIIKSHIRVTDDARIREAEANEKIKIAEARTNSQTLMLTMAILAIVCIVLFVGLLSSLE